MPSNHNDPDYAGLKARLKTGAPSERDTASLGRVRSQVAPRRRTAYGWGAVATTAVAAAVVAIALLWQPVRDTGPDSSAFAYDRVEELISPVEGVVHMVLQHETVLNAALLEDVPDEANQPWSVETWVAADQSAIRYEMMDPGNGAVWYVVLADGRRLNFNQVPDMGPYVTEVPYDPAVDANGGGGETWMESALTRSFARAVEERSCEVTETVDDSGTPVWVVTWTEEDELNRREYEVLFRRPDYRPLRIFTEVAHKDPTGEFLDGEDYVVETTVETWEVVDTEDVPDDLFDTRADITRVDTSFLLVMEPEDERIADVGFRAFTVSDEASVGSASRVTYSCGRLDSMFELEWPGMVIIGFGEDPTEFDWSSPAVLSFATDDRQDKQQWWGGHVFGSEESSGEVDGHAYELRSGGGEGALLMTSVDGQAVVITGPDAETVLRMLGALEPLE